MTKNFSYVGDFWNDKISSIIVVSGTWQFWRHANFQKGPGDTDWILRPGYYPWVEAAGISDHQISSFSVKFLRPLRKTHNPGRGPPNGGVGLRCVLRATLQPCEAAPRILVLQPAELREVQGVDFWRIAPKGAAGSFNRIRRRTCLQPVHT